MIQGKNVTLPSLRTLFKLYGAGAQSIQHVMLNAPHKLAGLVDLTDQFDEKIGNKFLIPWLCHYELYNRLPINVNKDLVLDENPYLNPVSRVSVKYFNSKGIDYSSLADTGSYGYFESLDRKILIGNDLRSYYTIDYYRPITLEPSMKDIIRNSLYTVDSYIDQVRERIIYKKYVHPENLDRQVDTYGGVLIDMLKFDSNYDFDYESIVEDIRQGSVTLNDSNIKYTFTPEELKIVEAILKSNQYFGKPTTEISIENGETASLDQMYNTSRYVTYYILAERGNLSQFEYLDNRYGLSTDDDLLKLCIAKHSNVEMFNYLYSKLSSGKMDKINIGRDVVRKSRYIAEMLVLALLFNSQPIIRLILTQYSLDDNHLFEYMLVYLPSISEYSIDLLIKHGRFDPDNLPFQLDSDFIVAVGQKDLRTYKILETYVDEDLKTQLRQNIGLKHFID